MLFVTGATGYLGSALVELLVDEGHQVRAMVRTPAKASVLPTGVEQAAGDISDEDALARMMEGCEGVFHFAAAMGASWEESRDGNPGGTGRVLRAAKRAGVRRVVYTSSSAAIIRKDGLVSERAENATALIDQYSVTKAEAEGVVFEAVRGGQDANIVNVVNAYGRSPAGPQSYNRLFLAAAAGKVPVVVDAQVGWILAEDVARAHYLAYTKGEPGKRYVACGAVATFPVVLDTFNRIWGASPSIDVLSPGSDIPRDKLWGHAIRSEAYGKLGPMSIDDANLRALGFAPAGLEDGLRTAAAWLRSIGAEG
jgi:dihydroflavonol-4-reductase